MSYYPTNFYSNYPYNTNQYQQPQYTFPQPQMQNTLQGKIVESEDMVRVADVPMGSYGIFPRADLSEIYVKTWNNNGTTSILSFQPVIKEEALKESSNNNEVLLEKINQLSEKLENLTNQIQENTNKNMQLLPQTIINRKEF